MKRTGFTVWLLLLQSLGCLTSEPCFKSPLFNNDAIVSDCSKLTLAQESEHSNRCLRWAAALAVIATVGSVTLSTNPASWLPSLPASRLPMFAVCNKGDDVIRNKSNVFWHLIRDQNSRRLPQKFITTANRHTQKGYKPVSNKPMQQPRKNKK